MVDPVYSGKALCGMLDLMKKTPGTFQGKRLMFVHTGGVYGMYDKVSFDRPLDITNFRDFPGFSRIFSPDSVHRACVLQEEEVMPLIHEASSVSRLLSKL